MTRSTNRKKINEQHIFTLFDRNLVIVFNLLSIQMKFLYSMVY